MLSKHIGLKGAPADFITQFIGSKELIDEKIGEISSDYLKVISGYAQGLNSYAENNPDKVLYKKLFPITPKMMMMYSQLQLFISCLLYTSPSPRDGLLSRMPSSA